MAKRKINLEEILHKVLIFDRKEDLWIGEVLTAMKEACKQTLVLATKNAKIENFEMSGRSYARINVQSILNTINQIE